MAAKKPPAQPRKATTPKAGSNAVKPPTRAAAPRSPKETGEGMAPSARIELSREELQKLISEAAYYRAKQRGFEPGHEVEDWVQAEAEVMRRLGGRSA